MEAREGVVVVSGRRLRDPLRRQWNAINPMRCSGTTNKGVRCRSVGHYKAQDGSWRCMWHREYT